MSKLKENIYDLLKGNFLINEAAFDNWKFIIFVVVLILSMIASSHKMDNKVMQIAKLSKEVKELRAEFVDTRSSVMKLKLESTIEQKAKQLELSPPTIPPFVIKVITNKTN